MKRSIATVSLGGSLDVKIDAIAAAGYDGLEIFDNDLVYFNLSPEQVGGRVREAGLEVTLFQPFRDFEAMPEAYRQRNLDRAERKFDVMEQLGAPLLLVCSSVSPEALDDPERAAADLYELAEQAQRRGLRIGFEALAWGRYAHHYQQAWDIVRRADHPHLGLILDTYHTLIRRSPLEDIEGIPVGKIFLVQVADAPAIDMDMLQLSRHYRCYPGQGELPVVAMMKKLVAIGYQGAVSHEIFNDQFRAASTRVTALDGMRSLLWLEEQLGGEGPIRPAKTAASPAPMVPAPALHGVEFIEFAVFGDRHGDKGDIYEMDFVADPEGQDSPGLGLTRVDHLGQALAPTELLSWVMYYKSILGLDFEASQALADPFGIIVSRSLINVMIFARGINIALHTRLYFDDEAEANAADPVIRLIELEPRRKTLLARREERDGKVVYRFDIHLQGDKETVFFDV